MFKFLNEEEGKLNTSVNKDIDPVAVALELGAGMEELNAELIRVDVLNKAATGLEKTIDLDNQIAANNLANRGTVSYGIEALEVTAIFLGVDMDIDNVAAGLEDNDQEGAADKKEGFLAKIKKAATDAWDKIIAIVKKIINKVKEFFSSKAISETAEKAEKAGEKVSEKLGGDSKKPSCKEEDVKKEKEAIVRQAPGYIYLKGMKSVDDVRNAINMYLDNETVSSLEEMEKYLSKDIITTINVVNEVVKNAESKGDETAMYKKVEKLGEDLFNNFQPGKIKQNKLRQELAKKFEDDIIKEAGLDKDKEDLDYNIIITSESTNKGKLALGYTIYYKNKKEFETFKEVMSEVKNVNSALKNLESLIGKIKVKSGTATVNVSKDELLKKVEPFTGKDIIDLSKELEDMKKRGDGVFKNMEEKVNKIEKEIKKAADELKKMDKVETKNGVDNSKLVGSVLRNYINSLLTASSKVVKDAAATGTTKLKVLSDNVVNLTSKCAGGEPSQL